jgi:hypothetical protein
MGILSGFRFLCASPFGKILTAFHQSLPRAQAQNWMGAAGGDRREGRAANATGGTVEK